MAAIYVTNPVEVDNRLEELGWTRDELLEVVSAMVSARRSCTDNDPMSAPGWMAWKDGTRRLREIGRAKGLEKAEFEQIPCVVNPSRKLRFSVCNTDDGTGIESRVPQQRSKKGPGTEHAANDNQTSFMEKLEETVTVVPITRARPVPGIVVSWFLCTYCEGEEIRAELSCPTAFEGGLFAGFRERIVLVGPGEGDGIARRRLPDDGPEFDIPVRRK